MKDKEVLNLQEAADLLEMAPQTLKSHIDAGYIPALHIGRIYRIARKTIDAILQGGFRK